MPSIIKACDAGWQLIAIAIAIAILVNSGIALAARQGALSPHSSSGQVEIRLVIHPKLAIDSPPKQAATFSAPLFHDNASIPLCIRSNSLSHYSVSVAGRPDDTHLQLTNKEGHSKAFSATLISSAQPFMQFDAPNQISPKLPTLSHCQTAPHLQIKTLPDRADETPYSGVATIVIQAQ